jgi:glycosyltransferase involved in cell wall biosynthesis
MRRFEHESLQRFTAVVAVSERDAKFFVGTYNVQHASAIPTGVDLDFFAWSSPPQVGGTQPPTVVFTGSMDWAANVNGVRFFLKEVWPIIHQQLPAARFVVVGRSPPESLVIAARNLPNVEFTGFVDDVRPYVHGAHAFVIPLLVGGGTRIKAFEAMAMGCPVVSTALGMEGLGAKPYAHYLECDQPAHMAKALLELLGDAAQQDLLSKNARQLVEERFGHTRAAKAFEHICIETISK